MAKKYIDFPTEARFYRISESLSGLNSVKVECFDENMNQLEGWFVMKNGSLNKVARNINIKYSFEKNIGEIPII